MVELLHSAPPEEQNKQQPPQRQMDWGAFVKDLIMKHPKEIKALVRDLDPDSRAMVFELIETKYPGYAGIAKMVMGGSGNGNNSNGNRQEQEDEDSNEYPDDPGAEHHEPPQPDMDIDILNEAADYAGSLYLNGYNWTQISDMLYQKYDIDWHPIRVQSVVLKRLAWKSNRTEEKEKKPVKEVVVQPTPAPEPHRGWIRQIWYKVW